MTIAFISDLHLTPERPQSTVLFAEFLEKCDGLVESLYILGDLFEYWVGDDGAGALGHQDVEAALRRTVEAGIPVYFLHGNRDFLVGEEFAGRSGCTLLPDPVTIDLAGRPVLLTHGDALCTDDVEHQEARKTMLSSKWKMAFLGQSLEQRMQTAAAMRNRSELGKQSKDPEMMDVNQAAVESLMREHGVKVLIHGHTHLPGVHEFPLDGENARRYVLGDWYTQRSVLYFNDGKLALTR
jgi:UDP-2,3-diacylglucosamine hydrolase